jgi:hypothetical protein
MRIELLYFEGCPKHVRTCEMLRNVLTSRGIAASVVNSIRVESATADELRFAASPTIRVEGRDIEPGFEDSGDYGLRCRLYPTARGADHTPAIEWIESAVDDALRREAKEARA